MLPRENRLTEKSDFAKVLKEGRIIGGVFLSLAVRRGDGTAPKVGFIVSNKISKKAVERNRLKRLMRRAARTHLSDIKNGTYLVFLAKRKAANAASEEITRESQALLKRSGVLKKWNNLQFYSSTFTKNSCRLTQESYAFLEAGFQPADLLLAAQNIQ